MSYVPTRLSQRSHGLMRCFCPSVYPNTRTPVTLYSQGTANILEAMKKTHVHRFLCISSGGIRPGKDSDLQSIVNRLGPC